MRPNINSWLLAIRPLFHEMLDMTTSCPFFYWVSRFFFFSSCWSTVPWTFSSVLSIYLKYSIILKLLIYLFIFSTLLHYPKILRDRNVSDSILYPLNQAWGRETNVNCYNMGDGLTEAQDSRGDLPFRETVMFIYLPHLPTVFNT